MVGDLGSDKALLSLVSRSWTMSRPGVVKARRSYVATQQMCCDRVVQRVRSSVCDRRSVRAAARKTSVCVIRI